MNVIEAVRTAWVALRTNKMRSLLTMLGIIIGVGAVIGMLAIGNGFNQYLNNQFSSFGVGVFYVGPFIDTRKVDVQQSAQLTADDARAIAQPGAAPAVKAVAVEYGRSATITAGRQRATYQARGVWPSYFAISDKQVSAGRFFSDDEEADRARVAVLGGQVAERLFGSHQAAIGQRIAINGVGFEVVGVIGDEDDAFGITNDSEAVFVPYETAASRLFRNQLNARVDVDTITVQARSREEVDAAIEQVTYILRDRHRLTYQDNDFTIISLDQIAQTVGAIIGGFNAFLGIVAGISLLVGGIGIMNIMLVSVTERTREIGLRKAVGARRWDILQQFLIEAVVLCLFGGLIGIGLGYLLSFVGTFVLVGLFQAEGAVAFVTPGAVLLATSIAALIGIFFGFFPALQAARLKPIEALRYE